MRLLSVCYRPDYYYDEINAFDRTRNSNLGCVADIYEVLAQPVGGAFIRAGADQPAGLPVLGDV